MHEVKINQNPYLYTNKIFGIKNNKSQNTQAPIPKEIAQDQFTSNNKSDLRKDFEETKKQQGIIGKAWDGIKNIFGAKSGSKYIEKVIKQAERGEISQEEAQEALNKYKEGQKTCIDVVADIASGILAVGAFALAVPTGGASLAVGLGLATAVGAGVKVGIKAGDAIATGKEYEILKTRTSGRFWADELPPESVTRYVLVDTLVNTCSAGEVPDVVLDGSGWPVSVTWKGMEYPLYEGEIGLLRSCSMVSGGWWSGNAELEEHFSGRTQAVREDTPYSVRFTQKMENALVNSAIRFIEIYKKEPRVHVKVIYDRKLHPQRVSEVHYVEFPLPDIVREIKTSNGGSVFTPFKDNIDNTCKSFYVTDAWVSYGSSDGTRVWSSASTPIVTFGNTEYYKNPESLQNSNRLLSMVYNNGWGTNFPMEYSGDVVCEYDLYWYPGEFDKEAVGAVTDTYLVKPVVVMNPAAREDISYRKWLNGEQID